MKKKYGFCVTLILCLTVLLLGCSKVEASSYIFKLNFNYISGIYTGDEENGKPSGEGEFICTDESGEVESISGKWSEGLPHGKGVVELRDGRSIEVKFNKGKFSGKAKVIEKDGSYSTLWYTSKGRVYGRAEYYNADGGLENTDYYYNGYSISDIKNDIEEIPYGDILTDCAAYKGSFIEINGTIKEGFETDTKIYLQIEDENGFSYIAYGNNITSYKTKQAYIANNLVSGKAIVYGEIESCDNVIAEDEIELLRLRGTIPFVRIVQLKEENEKEHLEADYEEIKEYPYYYTGVEVEDSGEIVNITIDSEEEIILYEVDSADGKKYFLRDGLDEDSLIYVPGQWINFKGSANGNNKVKITERGIVSYEKYPCIKVEKLAEGEKDTDE